MNETYREICENRGWSVTDTGDGNIELEKYSPAGEDFLIAVGEEGFVDNVKAYAASFDQEEHIEMWIEARHNGVNGVPSIKELVEDDGGKWKMTAKERICSYFETALKEEIAQNNVVVMM